MTTEPKVDIDWETGPLPDPDTLLAYEKFSPGAGSRIVALVEREMEARVRLEQMVLEGVNAERRLRSRSALWLAVSVAVLNVACVLIAGFVIHSRDPVVGYVLLVLLATSPLITAIVASKSRRAATTGPTEGTGHG